MVVLYQNATDLVWLPRNRSGDGVWYCVAVDRDHHYFFSGATQIKSAGRYLKEWGRLDPDVWPVHWAAHFWCVFYAFDRVGSFTNVKSLRY